MRQKDLEDVDLNIRHAFHVASNVRPLVWICIYLSMIPIFAFFYWLLPVSEWRVPEGGGTGYGSFLYYSIVTITTLGFGDYTPAHGMAQVLTVIEVMVGMVILSMFLNAIASMKSEIDVGSALEKRRLLIREENHRRLTARVPALLSKLHTFINYCSLVQNAHDPADLHQREDAMRKSAAHCSLSLDSVQNTIDLSYWPKLLDDCFLFVANYELFSTSTIDLDTPAGVTALHNYISENLPLAKNLESQLTAVALPEDELKLADEEEQQS